MVQLLPENSPLARRLRRAAREDALPHAMLFSGSGDRLAAARFAAAAMECQEAERPCLRCQQCRKILADIHPDVVTVTDPEHRELPVERLRQLRQDAYIRPNDGPRKVYIFPDGEALNQRDQNVLLKIVEEGPPYAAFFFCAETSAQLLPTIRSRCVEWKLSGGQESDGGDEALELCRAFATGKLLPLSQYLVGLENKRLKREQLQSLLESAWRAAAEALLAACGKPHPADIPGAEELRRALSVRQLRQLTELLRQYSAECRYNVGVGHVLGALCAQWEQCLIHTERNGHI